MKLYCNLKFQLWGYVLECKLWLMSQKRKIKRVRVDSWVCKVVLIYDKINFVPRLPHMGWNDISSLDHPIFEGIDNKNRFLFFILIFLKQILGKMLLRPPVINMNLIALQIMRIFMGFNSILKKAILMV